MSKSDYIGLAIAAALAYYVFIYRGQQTRGQVLVVGGGANQSEQGLLGALVNGMNILDSQIGAMTRAVGGALTTKGSGGGGFSLGGGGGSPGDLASGIGSLLNQFKNLFTGTDNTPTFLADPSAADVQLGGSEGDSVNDISGTSDLAGFGDWASGLSASSPGSDPLGLGLYDPTDGPNLLGPNPFDDTGDTGTAGGFDTGAGDNTDPLGLGSLSLGGDFGGDF